jgi:hypothetical protein
LTIPLGAVLGVILGLIATTFIPVCCNSHGCHSCLEFNGMVGYEASAYIGLLLGAISAPVLYTLLLIYFNTGRDSKQ